MGRRISLVGLLQTSLIAICSVLLLSLYVSEQKANGQKKGVSPTAHRWEYCAAKVTEVYGKGSSKTIGVASICYLKSSGAQCEKVEITVDGPLAERATVAQTNSLAKVVGKLGDAGWEMVSEGLGPGDKGEVRSLYFKRPVL